MFHPEFMAMLSRGLQLKTLNVNYVQHPCSLINCKKLPNTNIWGSSKQSGQVLALKGAQCATLEAEGGGFLKLSRRRNNK
jgi:hypothetical protein